MSNLHSDEAGLPAAAAATSTRPGDGEKPTALDASYPDPFLVKAGSVYVLGRHEKDLRNAPLLAGPTLCFYRGALAEVYANDFIDQAEIDAIILALTPAPPEELICGVCASEDTEMLPGGKVRCLECGEEWTPEND